MTDTPDAVRTRYRVMLMRRPGAERLKMACDMFDAARRLARAGLGDTTGTNRSPEFKVRLFLRIYGQDFDPETRARIVELIRLQATG